MSPLKPWLFPTVRMSTRVLLATLSIPITPERTDIARLLDMDGIIVEKHRRLATLLGLQSPPTRQSLINDMVRCPPPHESTTVDGTLGPPVLYTEYVFWTEC